MTSTPSSSGHGGARPGAGRKAAAVRNEGHHVSLPPWAVAALRALGDGSISRGVVAALERLGVTNENRSRAAPGNRGGRRGGEAPRRPDHNQPEREVDHG